MEHLRRCCWHARKDRFHGMEGVRSDGEWQGQRRRRLHLGRIWSRRIARHPDGQARWYEGHHFLWFRQENAVLQRNRC